MLWPWLGKILLWQTAASVFSVGIVIPVPGLLSKHSAEKLAVAPIAYGAEQLAGDIRPLSGDILSQSLTQKLPMAARRLDARPQRRRAVKFNLQLSSQHYVVIDDLTGQVLASSNPDEVRAIGSLTKLAAALTVLNNFPRWDSKVTVEAADGKLGGLFFKEGETVTVKDLFYASLVGSSNNATMALARSTGLTVVEFADQMNQEAAMLGLTKTHFVEPTGLNAANQSTAREVARLLQAAMGKTEIARALHSAEYACEVSGEQRRITSTDLLLAADLSTSRIAAVLGGKTGFVDEAGYCFSAVLKNAAERRITVVVLGADNHYSRFEEAKALAEWVYRAYVWPGETGYDGLTTEEN